MTDPSSRVMGAIGQSEAMHMERRWCGDRHGRACGREYIRGTSGTGQSLSIIAWRCAQARLSETGGAWRLLVRAGRALFS
ncbi:hypothetical protein WME90_33360 [Sorangium sp. So ce375]|uniref:hypothetical protein n=1 Tax=Sorangium sp. So ce375 TaxID=3133306 RepID=UPI003F5C0A1A